MACCACRHKCKKRRWQGVLAVISGTAHRLHGGLNVASGSAQVDQRSEAVLAPIYGVMVPFHVLTVKGATYSADGDHAIIRLNFNFGPSWEPGVRFPGSIMLKELSYRSSDARHAAKVCGAALLMASV